MLNKTSLYHICYQITGVKNMDVAIYIRVSTTGQELNNQEIALKKYIDKTDNWNLYKVYADVKTGADNKRTAFKLLFNDAHKKLFDIVLFWDLSRFSRAGTLFTLQKLKELENLGIEWHSYQDPYFSSIGEFKDVVVSIMATIAKIERLKISERTKGAFVKRGGKTVARESGKIVGRRPIPHIIINRVRVLLDKGFSYREISNRVTYKVKYGKIKHVSISQISKIKNNKI